MVILKEICSSSTDVKQSQHSTNNRYTNEKILQKLGDKYVQISQFNI